MTGFEEIDNTVFVRKGTEWQFEVKKYLKNKTKQNQKESIIKKRRIRTCREVMVKAPLEGVVEEREGAEEWERDLEEGGWVAPGRAPARQGSAYARNAVPRPPIKLESPVTR
jgi:hypothetical protein